MFFYNGEDPATGSAAGPCAAWAVQYGVVPADQQVLMEQGVEMKRRSRIFFSAGRNGDRIVNVRVGGSRGGSGARRIYFVEQNLFLSKIAAASGSFPALCSHV